MNLFLVDRVAFEVFGVPVYWYGIIITSAIVLDFFLLGYFCRKFGYDKDMPFDLVLSAVLLGIVGARLFSVIFDSGASIADFFNFRDGGMSIVGALIGGVIGVGIYCLIKKTNFFLVTDALAPLVLFSQSIGRWGNFFNGEVYGKLITNSAYQWFPLAVKVGNNWYQALFFYESILNLLGAILILCLFFKFRKNFGIATGAYLIYYGTVRFFLEPLRDAEFILRLGKLPISQIMSAVMVIVGIAIIVVAIVNHKKKSKELSAKMPN